MSKGIAKGKLAQAFVNRSKALSYRAHFTEAWCAFLHENFQSPEHAAVVFNVDGSTAGSWWRGNTAPSGWVVAMAFRDADIRDAALQHFAGDDE